MEKYPLLNLRDVLNLLNLEKPSQFWWEKDCRITNEGFFPKRLTADDMNILTVLEFDALDTMLNGLELKLPTTPAEVVDWAERCGFADVLPDDFVAAHKLSEAMGSDEELKNGFNYGLTGSIIRHLAGDGVFNVDWQYWLDLPKWTPEQAVCLLYGIDSDALDNHQCRNLLVKLTRKAEFRGNMTPYQWQQFGIEQKLLPPKQILLIEQPTPEPQQTEVVMDAGERNGNTKPDTKKRRDNQIAFICVMAKELKYKDLLNIPEGGKAIIKAECLKNSNLFTEDGFKKAWVEAGKRNLISMRDKEKYL